MILNLICIGLVIWVLYMGIKFYRSTNWNEPAESSPDFGEMRKKEAQLLHVQDVLQDAVDHGKLSKNALDEYRRYADTEIGHMNAIRKEWDEQRPSRTPS